ncbi:C4-dicarboxylate ABC transporter substrate-binding protein [Parazoarcus communis]|uniref:C4-dicarboxylate ABC transporter substrate-binding protein n=1 Tax=Parazoarcus communis TaxID=41977 RepID=A0A2U8GS60_9RHOO|nr:TRAP transporter substrate-binding protein DctP [Parazoarcus communis]AWI76334.1 C4-dicarboxylate ABC transporter substrate-binding protein [Parazoarcus communis]
MKVITRRNALKALSIGAVGAAANVAVSTPALAQETVTWRMQALWDGGTTPQKFEERFVKRVGELTGGKFQIELFSAGQLVPANQAFDAVRGGAFQLMKTFDGYEAGKIPGLAFTSTVPFGFPEPDQFEAWFYELGGLELARQAYAPAGLFYIAPTVYGPEPIHSKFPIRSLADMSGKKGRFVGLASSVMGALGVAVTPMATAEVYSALDKGVIDFADRGDLSANLEAGLSEVAKYIVMPGPHQPTTATSYVANRGAYDRLPAEFKAALAVAARETSSALRQHIMVSDGKAIEAFRAKGVEVTSLDPKEVAAGRVKAREAWKAATKNDPTAVKILESQMAFMKQLGLLS